MDVLARILGGGGLRAGGNGGVPGPSDDFWYQPVGAGSSVGLRVDVEAAQRVSAFYSGLRLLSNDVAKLPLEVLLRLADGGKTRALRHPLYDVLHTQPNVWQTSFEWRRQGMRHLILRGNWYNRIVPGPRGAVDQLVPILPDLVTPEQLPSGRILYHIKNPKTNISTPATQDEICHVRGVSDDGVTGKSVLTWARDSIGIALATETYAGKLFSQGALHGGLITVPGVLDEEASLRMAESFVTSAKTWHLPKVLEQGATYAEPTLTPEDSQFLLSRQFSVTEMARWLGLPPHKIQDLSRSTNNNIEEQGIDYVGDGLSPWLVLIESAFDRDLVLLPAKFLVEFNADGLMRGNSSARGDFYQKMFGVGAYSQNDIRHKENENSIDNGDTYYVPANFRPSDQPFTPGASGGAPPPAGTPPPKNSPPQPPEPDPNAPRRPKAEAIVGESAARLLRKEITAVQKAAVKYAADADAFTAWVTEFYVGHATLVAQTLQLAPADAEAYCWSQAQQIVNGAGWVAALELWAVPGYAAGLAGIALEEDAAA